MLTALVLVASAAVVLSVLGLPCTSFGWLGAAAVVLGLAALLVRAPWRKRLGRAALVVVCLAVAGCLRDANFRHARMASVSTGHARSSKSGAAAVLPAAPPAIEPTPTLSGAIVDEEVLALLGARAVIAANRIPEPEIVNLVDVLQDGYRRMKESDGRVPTPVGRWLAGAAPEALMIEPEGVETPSLAVVFLHGWGGSWTLPCWQVAQAARAVGAVTVCPAIQFEGDWWSEVGKTTAGSTITALQARGLRVVLVGLWNGGIGASLIAPSLGKQLSGLVLVSGASPEAGRSGVPTLVLHGAHDHMVPAQGARQYCRRTGARFVAFEGTHFALLEKHDEMTAAIVEFLRAIPRP